MNNCSLCNGTGKFEEPNNMEAFDKEFERLDSMGDQNMDHCRKKALEYSGYTIIDCPKCNGTGTINK
jgi:RecJ-like exonuclease